MTLRIARGQSATASVAAAYERIAACDHDGIWITLREEADALEAAAETRELYGESYGEPDMVGAPW
jgi:hypothetical protein